MHLEFLVEDLSGKVLLGKLIPRILGQQGSPHTWNLHSYKGIGRIPQNLNHLADPSKRILLDRLPQILKGYGQTPGYDAVVVVLDSDRRNCQEFLQELKDLLQNAQPAPQTLFRLAIEEMEAWYFGDRTALLKAYPKAKKGILDKYKQDSVCGTWETLADAIHTGGSAALPNFALAGKAKSEWAERIGEHMSLEENQSPSFLKFRDGIRRLISMGRA
jgi:hypothetical protein